MGVEYNKNKSMSVAVHDQMNENFGPQTPPKNLEKKANKKRILPKWILESRKINPPKAPTPPPKKLLPKKLVVKRLKITSKPKKEKTIKNSHKAEKIPAALVIS